MVRQTYLIMASDLLWLANSQGICKEVYCGYAKLLDNGKRFSGAMQIHKVYAKKFTAVMQTYLIMASNLLWLCKLTRYMQSSLLWLCKLT